MSAAENSHQSLLIDYYVDTTQLRRERARHYETQSQALMALAGTLLGIVAATAAAADPPLLPVLLAVLPLSLAVVFSSSRSFSARRPDAILERYEDEVDRIEEADTYSAGSVVAVWRRRADAAQKEERRAAAWATATLVALGISSAPLSAVALSAAS